MNFKLKSPYFDVLLVAPVVMETRYGNQRNDHHYDVQRASTAGPGSATSFSIQTTSGSHHGFSWPWNYQWVAIQ